MNFPKKKERKKTNFGSGIKDSILPSDNTKGNARLALFFKKRKKEKSTFTVVIEKKKK